MHHTSVTLIPWPNTRGGQQYRNQIARKILKIYSIMVTPRKSKLRLLQVIPSTGEGIYRFFATSGGIPGEKNWHQPPLYFAADDLQYQAAFPSERLGMGAFRIALESVFNRIHNKPLEFTCFGKPNPFVFRNAETILGQLLQTCCHANARTGEGDPGPPPFKTLYMIGDNPLVDIKGAQQAGYPWFSILTRTGVFRQRENHTQYPADLVVDAVEDAVEFILKREHAL